jgi:hypothetical protein
MISVILNVYKRPLMLEKQIQAVLNQSVPIRAENIHVWYNKSDAEQHFPIDPKIKTYACNWNTKFWGRFTVPLLVRTPYVAMFDDDLIPPKNWFKNCLDTIGKPETNGILGGSGVIIQRKAYIPYNKVGWNGEHLNATKRVDLVGHAWFFRQEWIKYLFYEKPYTWENGEDITFSYLAQKYGSINTFTPPHPEEDRSMWCTDYGVAESVGSDINASWRVGNHLDIRNEICVHCINNGWKTVNNIK